MDCQLDGRSLLCRVVPRIATSSNFGAAGSVQVSRRCASRRGSTRGPVTTGRPRPGGRRALQIGAGKCSWLPLSGGRAACRSAERATARERPVEASGRRSGRGGVAE
jgi:hypothetical protein